MKKLIKFFLLVVVTLPATTQLVWAAAPPPATPAGPPTISKDQAKDLRKEFAKEFKRARKNPPNEEVNKKLSLLAGKVATIEEGLDRKGEQYRTIEQLLKGGFNFDAELESVKDSKVLLSPAGVADPARLGKINKLQSMVPKIQSSPPDSQNVTPSQVLKFLKYLLKLEDKATKAEKGTSPAEAQRMVSEYAKLLADAAVKVKPGGPWDISKSRKTSAKLIALSERLGTGTEAFSFVSAYNAARKTDDMVAKLNAYQAIVPKFKYVEGDKKSKKYATTFLKRVVKLKKKIDKVSMTDPAFGEYIELVRATKDKFATITELSKESSFEDVTALAAELATGFSFVSAYNEARKTKALRDKITKYNEIVPKFVYVPGNKTSKKYASRFLGRIKKLSYKVDDLPLGDPLFPQYAKLVNDTKTKFGAIPEVTGTKKYKSIVELAAEVSTGYLFKAVRKLKKHTELLPILEKLVPKVPRDLPSKRAKYLVKRIKKLYDYMEDSKPQDPTGVQIRRAQIVFRTAAGNPAIQAVDKKRALQAIATQLESGVILKVEINKVKKKDSNTRIVAYKNLLNRRAITSKTEAKKLRKAMYSLSKKMRSEGKKQFNTTMARSFVQLADQAKANPHFVTYRKKLDGYILKVYDGPLDDYNDAVKDIAKQQKYLAKLERDLQSKAAKATTQKKQTKFQKWQRTTYPKKKSKYQRKLSEAQREQTQAQQFLGGAPAVVQAKMRR